MFLLIPSYKPWVAASSFSLFRVCAYDGCKSPRRGGWTVMMLVDGGLLPLWMRPPGAEDLVEASMLKFWTRLMRRSVWTQWKKEEVRGNYSAKLNQKYSYSCLGVVIYIAFGVLTSSKAETLSAFCPFSLGVVFAGHTKERKWMAGLCTNGHMTSSRTFSDPMRRTVLTVPHTFARVLWLYPVTPVSHCLPWSKILRC